MQPYNECPTDITRLTAKLTRVSHQNKEHKRVLDNLASRMGLNATVGAGNRASMNSSTESIPHTAKDQNGGGGAPAAASSATRGGNANDDTRGGGCGMCKKCNTRNPNSWKA